MSIITVLTLLSALSALSALPASAGNAGLSDAVRDALLRLDSVIEKSGDYTTRHQLNLVNIENYLHSWEIPLEQQYDIYNQLYEGNLSYQFDAAMSALDNMMSVAEQLGDKDRIADVNLKKAMLCTTAGMFLDADNILHQQIDTLSLTPSQTVDYYLTSRKFYTDYAEYKRVKPSDALSCKARYYTDKLLESTPEESELHRNILVFKHLNTGDYESADRINSTLLSLHADDSHEYAIYAYFQGVICHMKGDAEGELMWYLNSAVADIKSSVKDNASLCCLAKILLEKGDIERSFRYINISLDDALFYNARLRQWQISTVIPVIEEAYLNVKARHAKTSMKFLTALSVLFFMFLLIVIYVLYLNRKRRIAHKEMKMMNVRIMEYSSSLAQANASLEKLNSELRKANAAKEEYLGLFLSMCSSYIDKISEMRNEIRNDLKKGLYDHTLKLVSSKEIMQKELDEFYDVFDNAFLQLYPNFITEFNALLKPECQIRLKKGELLNTELRIFALIRMGIVQSSHIASLLRYSVNTIYNYRAQIKNSSLYDRDEFEERIKKIG